ncbi:MULTISPECIES: endonuclease MutS2 [Clostridium]|uniref:Endonuclease MutS2 n=2 Tax=Clostridium butyricum TaxID=1492 RepID=C4IHZ5_CLOBU|nr:MULTISPECIES: endonuclease MutS2 [Clostridium]ALP89803.1 recombination and DNA strand exchange inhibitor protein [Clostridium butyricum]ALS16255.1 recombination and DNA strand exchange inhibitor protein [Clostridium butyricum]ANF13418.1 recombination and DNA strand exchange inhibitor protein [Clostridium butyricum]AOR93487.1 endonuclease MutS2 [Clostridium butyricum]APF23997.1 MutS2 family protein [Clostridium butyricum]
MNEKSLRILEFNKIKDKIKKYARTNAGKEKISDLAPYDNVYEINNKLDETNEALEVILDKGNPPLEGLFDIHEGVERARKGGTLTPEQLLKIGSTLRAARNMKEFFKREDFEKAYERLEDLAYILTPVKNLEDDIERSIVSEEEISDKASATLYNIRRSLKEKNSSVREKISSIVRSHSKYLQDDLYTMRGDRYVIPVKSEYKSAVPGIVHDQSSTGATFFIEPMSLVNLNNEIRELVLKEKAEIDRILAELSFKVKENSEQCLSNFKMLVEFDFIFAKARYGERLNAVRPLIREDGRFNIYSGRHPMIDDDKVVPSDVYIGEDFDTLMITGPNTGGKTVTIKMVGLLHIMGLSGLLIPARDNSSLSFFTEVFAEIGDEQSIEQNLSTFSSHMTNIVEIMRYVDDKSLVLFDEIGSGTDPAEGAALAISIIETLRSRKSRIIATTHYSELKAYALKTDGVENASVEFDIETLRPTYRLLIGVPGKSNAFEISKRLGLVEGVIKRAKAYMSEENLQFENLIRDLQEKSIVAKKEAREASALKKEAEELKLRYEDKLQKLEKARDKAYMDARHEAKEIIANAKEEADEILKAMRALEKMGIEGGGRARLEEERKKLKDSLEHKEKGLHNMKENEGEPITNVTLGMEAFLPSLNQTVVIISMPDNRGDVQVEAGIMKINVKLKDLRKTKVTKQEKVKKKREVKLNLSNIESRVDLRGMDSEEACYKTDKYLDDAYRANLGEVTIVHGKGTGVLRNAITAMLKRHPHVKSFRLGVYGEGGDGVTVVELKA